MKIDTFFENFELLTDAPNAVAKLRELILELAVRGKLVPQVSNDKPAQELLKEIGAEKKQLIKKGNIKKSRFSSDLIPNKIPYDIPESWEWVTLGEIGESNIGLTYSPSDVSDTGIPVLRSNNIQKGKLDLTDLKRVNIEIKESYYVQEGDLLICARNGSKNLVGKTALIQGLLEPMAFGAFMAIFRSKFNEYVFFFINSPLFRRMINDVNTMTINQITQQNLKSTIFPLPPLAEQKRIVEKCDRLLSTCDEIEKRQQQRQESILRMNESAIAQLLTSQNPDDFRQHWQRICNNFDLLYSVPETIPKLRQAILQLAVQGKLVRQDPNDEPASVLLEKIKLEKEWLVKEKKIRNSQILPAIKIDQVALKLPVGWEWTRLDDICSKITDGVHKTPKYTDCGIHFLSVTQLKNGKLDFSNTKYISPEDHQIFYQRCNPEKGNILICKVGGTIGVTTVVEVDIEFSIFVQLALIKQIIVNPYYLKLVLLSDEVQNYIKENSVGSAMPYISLEKLKYILVPLPPLAEQQRIVEKCDRLMSLCDTLEIKLKQGRDSSEKLIEVAAKQVLTA
jgi:type I restriction enzyme, S subunit